jgi:ABC-type Fe3+ transport system permease subunit
LAGGGDRRAGFSSGGVATAVADGETWKLAGFTVAQAAASPMLAVLAGLPVAFLLARVLLPGIALVRTLVLVPFVLPTVVVGLAFRALSPDGGSRRSCWPTRSSTWPCWRGPSCFGVVLILGGAAYRTLETVAGGCAVLGLLLVPIIAPVVKSVSTSDG